MIDLALKMERHQGAGVAEPTVEHDIFRRYKEQRGVDRPPMMLYKFLSNKSEFFASGLVELLFHSRVFLSSRGSFNDPFDARVIVGDSTTEDFQRLKESVIEFGQTSMGATEAQLQNVASADPSAAAGYFQTALEGSLEETGIYSMTAEIEAPLMWAHYANAHKGVCIAFAAFTTDIQLRGALPVVYGSDHPKITNLDYRQILDGLLHKGKDWLYEHEWRVVRPASANTFFDIDVRCVQALVLGARSDESTARTMRSMLEVRTRLGLPPVRLYRAIQQEGMYELAFRVVWPTEGPVFETVLQALKDSVMRERSIAQ